MSTALLEEEMTDTPAASARLLSAGPAAPGQEAAWEQFTKIPMPTRTDERWRFANVKDLDLSPYTPPQVIDEATREDLLARSRGLASAAGRMVFANDQLLSREVLSESLSQLGVIWLPLEQALVEHPDLLQQYFMREEAILGGQKFAALHASQVRTGMLLFVPRGIEIDLPVEAFHWLHGANSSCFPHTLIIAEERAKVTVVDYYESADANAPGLACAVNDLWLGAGAQVTYVCAQNWSSQALAFQINATVVGRDAHARSLFAQLGARHVRSESVSHLRGAGGRSDMLAVTVADNAQEVDARTFQIHEAPNTSSDLLYKNSLDDAARTIFSGLIRVDPGAQMTDAYQKVRNLLLSDDAEANSAPGLEIEADNVRCTHGATSGQIEQEELFYLMSRGISKRAAQRLIVKGFLQEAIDRLDQPVIGARLAEMVQAKFATHR
ncbi:MAG TPA: Fe-S cluster assembly protein SufD [Chthoniobacter sp.]|nr:Fe-S cluster assembly protein SufD [Chthoniobacter sp.]